MAAKYYAVRKGRNTGIYRTWDECKSQVFQYAGAEYKSFTTEQEALEYIGRLKNNDVQSESYAYVDGSFNIVTGVYGYGGFLVYNNEKYIITGSGSDSEMASMRNVAGEILGSMAAVEKAIELGVKSVDIYFDYMGIRAWALGEWKRNKKGTIAYYDYMQSVKDKIAINFVKVKGHSGVEGNEPNFFTDVTIFIFGFLFAISEINILPFGLNPKILAYGIVFLDISIIFLFIPSSAHTKIRCILVCVYLLDFIAVIKSVRLLQFDAALLIVFSSPSETSGKSAICATVIFLKVYIISFSYLLRLSITFPFLTCCPRIW